jgi:hypothetical protein
MDEEKLAKLIRQEVVAANGGKKNAWVGLLGVAVGAIGLLAAFLLFVFIPRHEAEAMVSSHKAELSHKGQMIINDGVSKRLDRNEKKIDAAVYNTVRIGERLRVDDLKGQE